MDLNIGNIKPYPAVSILCLFATLLLGYSWLFLFQRELFMTLDLFRLSVLSFSISLPCLCVNICILTYAERTYVKYKKRRKLEDFNQFAHATFFGCLFTMLSLCTSIAVKIADDDFTVYGGITVVGIFHAIVFALFWFDIEIIEYKARKVKRLEKKDDTQD